MDITLQNSKYFRIKTKVEKFQKDNKVNKLLSDNFYLTPTNTTHLT